MTMSKDHICVDCVNANVKNLMDSFSAPGLNLSYRKCDCCGKFGICLPAYVYFGNTSQWMPQSCIAIEKPKPKKEVDISELMK